MGLTYDISPSGGHVRLVGTGVITADEWLNAVGKVMRDPRRHPDCSTLVDLRDAVYQPKDDAEVVRVAETLESFPAEFMNAIAIVARQSTLFFAEVFSLHIRKTTTRRIRVFVDLHAAEAFCRGDWPPGVVTSSPDRDKAHS